MGGASRAWEAWGRRDPYYGVLTSESYRAGRMTEEGKARFFETGRCHADRVLGVIRSRLDPGFAPKRILDFGCGAGRVLLPLSERCEEAVGLDVSGSMLAECRLNCEAANRPNVRLVQSGASLPPLDGPFDLVHSYIVFQHIPRRKGERLIRELLGRLAPGGAAVLHVPFHWDAGILRRLAYGIRHRAPFAHAVMNRLRGRPATEPRMQMNLYNVNRLFRILDESGVRACHVEIERHGGHRSAVFYLLAPPRNP